MRAQYKAEGSPQAFEMAKEDGDSDPTELDVRYRVHSGLNDARCDSRMDLCV